MKKVISLVSVAFIILSLFSACKNNSPLSMDEMRDIAFTCFSEHKEEMESIIISEKASGKTNWCKTYGLLRDGKYEFVLQQTGFTGTNTSSGILYIPNDTPKDDYTQSTDNPNVYFYEKGYTDEFYLERMETNWFFYYSEYDF